MSKGILRHVLCAAAAPVLAVLLCACGSGENAEIIGTWVPTTANTNGEDIPYGDLELDEDEFGLVFSDSTNCTITLAGISTDTTYTFNGTSVDMTVNDTDYKLTYESGTLTVSLDYGSEEMTLTFTKER